MRLPIPVILAVLTLACLGLTACSLPPLIYRIDIQQGNVITPEMVACLKRGMTKAQVQSIMSTPALSHCLNTNRWDYYYSFKSGRTGKLVQKRFTVYFKNDRVTDWE